VINLSDPLDRLRAANPVPADQVLRTRPDPVLFRRITLKEPAGAAGHRPAPARRRAKWLVPAFLVAGLVGGATAYGLRRDEVTKTLRVACYERADLAAHTAVAIVGPSGPVAACAELWRQGAFAGAAEAPPLVECVLDSGVAGVFPAAPGEDVCARLALPPPAPTTSTGGPAPAAGDPNARILQFRDAVFAQFLDSPCVEPRVASATVRRELDRAGLSDWTIRGGEGLAGDGFSAERPCATLALQTENKEVVLVPTPARR
jgi:hypothetical protein